MQGSWPTSLLSSDEDAIIPVMNRYKIRRPSRGFNRFRSAAKSDAQRSKPLKATAIDRNRQRSIRCGNMSSSADVATPEREFRPRRTHKKSRLGCLQCKQARRKCDELKPSCTRCTSKNASCQYPGPSVSSPPSETSFDAPADFGDDDFWSQIQDLTIPTISMRSPSEEAPLSLPDTTGDLPSPYSSLPSPLSAGLSPADFVPRPDLVLDPRESELLSHYLSHTARKFAFDTDDLYALQIGFPSLAFRSRLLMRSVLALAAVCKCHDLLEQVSRSPRAAADEARELLGLADRYHSDSLSQTQAEIASVSCYEFVLANAPLMTLYGLASQSIRIYLTGRLVAAGQGHQIPQELTPAPSQWLSLIRAAHEAYSGMLLTGSSAVAASPAASLTPPPLGLGGSSNAGLISYDGNGKGHSKHLLLPILSATAGSALANLRTKVQGLHLTLGLSSSAPFLTPNGSQSPEQAQLQACVVALDVLGDIAAKICLGDTMTAQPAASAFGGGGSGMLQDTNVYRRPPLDISPWLQDYLARVTSSSPPVAFHRIITSFVNRVPGAFLAVVQDVLNQVPTQTSSSSSAPSPSGEEPRFPELGPLHKLAMDIFAHWLVFAVLMDGIWWVGDLGVWELRRVLALMSSQDGFDTEGGKWWPESVYRIRVEVGKHTD